MVENTCVQEGVWKSEVEVSTVWVNQLLRFASASALLAEKWEKNVSFIFLQFRDCRIHKSTGIDMYLLSICFGGFII